MYDRYASLVHRVYGCLSMFDDQCALCVAYTRLCVCVCVCAQYTFQTVLINFASSLCASMALFSPDSSFQTM